MCVLEHDWLDAVARVVAASNVIMVHTPRARCCQRTSGLKKQDLTSLIGIDCYPRSNNRSLKCSEVIDPAAFVWSVFSMHQTSFCPLGGCEECLPRTLAKKWAVCLAIIRSSEDFPMNMVPALNAGATWALIHPHELSVAPHLAIFPRVQVNSNLHVTIRSNDCSNEMLTLFRAWFSSSSNEFGMDA